MTQNEPPNRIQAIETRYNGYRFRSRLEARWAVFFDSLDIKYQYEPEGFDLGDLGYYLPDFYLPDCFGGRGCWVEVKPLKTEQLLGHSWIDESIAFPGDEANKVVRIVNEPTIAGRFGIVLYGLPGRDSYHIFLATDKDSFGEPEESYCVFGLCDYCHAIMIGHGDYWFKFHTSPFTSRDNCIHYTAQAHEAPLWWSYDSARSARFEHGEMP